MVHVIAQLQDPLREVGLKLLGNPEIAYWMDKAVTPVFVFLNQPWRNQDMADEWNVRGVWVHNYKSC
jgi:hypothetical protein